MDNLTTDELEAIKRCISFILEKGHETEEDESVLKKMKAELIKRKGVPKCSH